MPELPEVETTMRGVAAQFANATLQHTDVYAPKLRNIVPKRRLQALAGAKINTITRRAKYILLGLDNGCSIIIHLGMSGRLHWQPNNYTPQKHDHIVWHLTKPRAKTTSLLVFTDPRRFGVVDVCLTAELAMHACFKHLGPEPWDKVVTPPWLHQKWQKRSGAIKPVLLDQKIMVGVGNIYACEALFLSGIHPEKSANDLSLAQVKKLLPHVQGVMQAAIDAGGTSMRDYVQPDGAMGHFQDQFNVYDREGEPCLVCRTAIKRLTHAGRSSFYCPKCQK